MMSIIMQTLLDPHGSSQVGTINISSQILSYYFVYWPNILVDLYISWQPYILCLLGYIL